MMPLLITIYLTFIMEMSVEEMGFMDYLTGLISRTFPAWSIPVIAFVSVSVITFFAASFWSLIVISFPIFLPMAAAMGVNPSLVIGAVMSGVALGSQACLYSDAIFMVAAGTEVPNDVQFRTVLPYVLIGAACAAVLFFLAGLFL
jgi:Na+/H+ antiporter NhaC